MDSSSAMAILVPPRRRRSTLKWVTIIVASLGGRLPGCVAYNIRYTRKCVCGGGLVDLLNHTEMSTEYSGMGRPGIVPCPEPKLVVLRDIHCTGKIPCFILV